MVWDASIDRLLFDHLGPPDLIKEQEAFDKREAEFDTIFLAYDRQYWANKDGFESDQRKTWTGPLEWNERRGQYVIPHRFVDYDLVPSPGIPVYEAL